MDALNEYENDSFEFYFDANKSADTDSYDGVDDLQLRIEYDDTDTDGINADYGGAADWGFDKSTIQFAIADWERDAGDAAGWILEVAIPLEQLQIDAEGGTGFNFDVQMNDNDSGGRDNMLRWWGTNNEAWHQAQWFGEAELNNYVADEYMQIPMTTEAPEVDGVLDETWIENSVEIDNTKYTVRNGDTVPANFTEMEYWEDLRIQFRVMWDEDAFYFFGDIVDDEINTSHSTVWQNDSIELMFDGDNEKTTSYDTNDRQWRWVWEITTPTTGNEEIAWGYPEGDLDGYTLELKIPADDLTFPLEEGHIIGLEVQVNDNDEGARQNVAKWWCDDDQTWTNASLLGTAELSSGIPSVAVEKSKVVEPASYSLTQNYPNPFNPQTHISYSVPAQCAVKLAVYDLLGNKVATLVNQTQSAGRHTVTFDGGQFSSGIYVYRLETDNYIDTRKMTLLK